MVLELIDLRFFFEKILKNKQMMEIGLVVFQRRILDILLDGYSHEIMQLVC